MIRIDRGLFSNMVLQRSSKDVSLARFSGECSCDGPVFASVHNAGSTFEGFSHIRAGTVAKGKLEGEIANLPTGGPYDITLSCKKESLCIENVLVGDVWILAGQSNMHGVGFCWPPIEPNDMVRAFYMDDRWDIAEDPLHAIELAVDPVHSEIHGPQPVPKYKGHPRRRGPGVSFGQEMFRRTGIPQGLIACAHGGTTMTDWSPDKRDRGGHSLFGAMLRRFNTNGRSVAGVLWYQGCGETNEAAACVYTKRMQQFVEILRKELGNSALPFALVQIATWSPECDTNPKWWNAIQEQQRLLPVMVDNCVCVPAVDLELNDGIHIGGEGQIRLGKRLAHAVLSITLPEAKCCRPIEVGDIRIEPVASEAHCTPMSDVVVDFSHVEGALSANGLASGFAITNSEGHELPVIYKTDLKGNTAIIHTGIPFQKLAECNLHYGYGFRPYCNIVDSSDRSLPAFGPLALSYDATIKSP